MNEVVFYEKENGEIPVELFIESLPKKLGAKTLRNLMLLQEMEPEMRGEETKHLRDGVFELRTTFGSDATRILYFFFSGKRIVLTNGFLKKTQKTPARELDRAIRYKKDWERRFGDADA